MSICSLVNPSYFNLNFAIIKMNILEIWLMVSKYNSQWFWRASPRYTAMPVEKKATITATKICGPHLQAIEILNGDSVKFNEV